MKEPIERIESCLEERIRLEELGVVCFLLVELRWLLRDGKKRKEEGKEITS